MALVTTEPDACSADFFLRLLSRNSFGDLRVKPAFSAGPECGASPSPRYWGSRLSPAAVSPRSRCPLRTAEHERRVAPRCSWPAIAAAFLQQQLHHFRRSPSPAAAMAACPLVAPGLGGRTFLQQQFHHFEMPFHAATRERR